MTGSTRGPAGGWANAATVHAAVAARWDRGILLRDLHAGPAKWGGFPLRVRLPGPSRTEIPARFAEVAAWARDLADAARKGGWELQTRPVRPGGLGTQQLPVAAIVPDPETGLRLLGREYRATAVRFAEALDAATALDTGAVALALARPLDVLGAGEDWPLLLELARWVRDHPRPGVYLRQVPVAGVHTKVLEAHAGLLSRLLEAMLPADAVAASGRGFAARFGFATEGRRARVRGDGAVLGVPTNGVADVDWEIAALAALDPHVHGIDELLVLENKTSFLAAPFAPGRLVLFGAGYGVDELVGALPWRDKVALSYWGDIDTHGFAILAQVRAVAPHTKSVLMDAATLMAHRPFWSSEASPRRDPVLGLTVAERALYDDLRSGTYGQGVRLEQELVRFDLVEAALARS